MRKKIVLFVGAAAIALLATGCSETAKPAATSAAPAPVPSSPAPVATTSAPAAEPTSGSGAEPVAAVPVKSAKPKSAGDAGDGGNWTAALAGCPFDGQEVQVQKLVMADVTGDGVDDALVARTCTTTTTHWPSTVEVFDGTTGAKPKRLGTLLAEANDEGPWYVSSSVSGSVVTVKAYGYSAHTPLACPDLRITYKYGFSAGTFTRTSHQATKAKDCLPIR
ncbi:hypothetical protein GCM10010168_81230 [Actinoplanes ianthinogenes]|uniref:Lipoprotein n=1 Tax=Actinoplanes ianthinogenes TaxID=122358 RepID=A0ABM7LMV5_9ACTN|nr:hypothetical protein [Actinoplanes ianthinogenes]BCJ40543.1 hypothetical protein Aiant_12000 [Actinoplanes ianthinogenes]GGR50223.1 hypothetical protein GCM10010168_81230 [Actinoplanes ianthinogenes]